METTWTPEPLVGSAFICVSAPTFAASGPDGQLHGQGLDGFYDAELRVLNRLVLRIDGREPEFWQNELLTPAHAWFFGGHRLPRDQAYRPAITVERIRRLPELTEQITIRNSGRERHELVVEIECGTDLAELFQVRSGQPVPQALASLRPGGVSWSRRDTASVRLRCSPRPTWTLLGRRPRLRWSVLLDRGRAWTLDLSLLVEPARHRRRVLLSMDQPPWHWPSLRCDDRRLADLIASGLDDLASLLVGWPIEGDGNGYDAFLTAGAPWYLTLFGRDSLWAARMMLPLGTELAGGTLRTLARLQGGRHDPTSEEEPGKIVHEFRQTATHPVAGLSLPPRYYGSVDATPLFVALLGEAWRWGLDEQSVYELLPAAERALEWLRTQSDADKDGFIRYTGSPERGLRNQGWKDSPRAVQFADGRLPKPPIALAEVQAYAYEAARKGAALLGAFGRPGSDQWYEWAERLKKRFRTSFWVEDLVGPYIAVAVDADGDPVDAVTSNMGHLPGTGILAGDEIAHIAARLTAPDMNSGWGLRTLSAKSPGYNPFSYHEGSVWPHDTAIAISGPAANGRHAEAAALMSGLVEAAARFRFRLPELWSGEERRPGPLRFPAACRPQAWAAASSIALLQAVVGLYPDVPSGRLELRPMRPTPPGGIEVAGLRVADRELRIAVDEGGRATVNGGPSYLTVETR